MASANESPPLTAFRDRKDQFPTLPSAAASSPRILVVYLLRHGQARHNLPRSEFGGKSPYNLIRDPELTPLGIKQAEAVCMSLSKLLPPDDPPIDLIVCSPLRRAVDTAWHVFKPTVLLEKGPNSNSIIPVPLFVPDEFLQEGKVPQKLCDRGSYRSTLTQRFPHFGTRFTDNLRQGWYRPSVHQKNAVERAQAFREKLCRVQETVRSVFVVAHYVIIRRLLGWGGSGIHSPKNCELVRAEFDTGTGQFVAAQSLGQAAVVSQ